MTKLSEAALCAAVCAAICAACFSRVALAAQPAATVGVSAELKADKLKSIYRREPKAQALIEKVEANIATLKSNPATMVQGRKLESELLRIEMMGAGESEARLKEDVNLLEAASGPLKAPTSAELAPLQDRYKKLIADLDDRVLVKDFDRLLKRHDRFIRYTSLGLWDKDKIASELEKMEDMAASAPDIAFGKSESLKGLQDRRLVSVPKLVYMGSDPHEQIYLSPDRRSVGVLEEGLGGLSPIETADLVMQNPDGSWVELTTPNNPAFGAPFSPPLSLWMKTRMLEGRVPAITLKLADSQTIANFDENNPGTARGTTTLFSAQDVIDGKLDDYLKRTLEAITKTKQAALVGLFDNFDGELAANSFGKDGHTPFYMLDPKIGKLDASAAKEEADKKTEKGYFATAKTIAPELSNQYGDPAIPDGPERVRDAWKHIHQVVGSTAPNIGYYSTAGSFHGSKTAFKFPGQSAAGTQAWNKLDFYYPGDGVLDWIGVRAVGLDPSEEPKGANIAESVDQFFSELRTSSWQNTPVILAGVAPSQSASPASEAAWILTVFQKMIPGTYPNVSIVLVDAPEHLTLWSRDAASAYRTNVASNKFYKWPLRFKMLDQK